MIHIRSFYGCLDTEICPGQLHNKLNDGLTCCAEQICFSKRRFYEYKDSLET